MQLASALDNAHLRDHPVLHRDIKPSNIMIAPNDRVILTDFGIARLIGDVSLTLTGQIVGTPAYMAPELVQGEEADGRADVYAVGVVLYQMLTGQAPFRAQTPLALLHAHLNTPPPAPRTVMPTLPVAVDAVLLQALAKNPDERYQTAGALARAFRVPSDAPEALRRHGTISIARSRVFGGAEDLNAEHPDRQATRCQAHGHHPRPEDQSRRHRARMRESGEPIDVTDGDASWCELRPRNGTAKKQPPRFATMEEWLREIGHFPASLGAFRPKGVSAQDVIDDIRGPW